jgi:hypothetical protein
MTSLNNLPKLTCIPDEAFYPELFQKALSNAALLLENCYGDKVEDGEIGA